jgi:hypothetical protein
MLEDGSKPIDIAREYCSPQVVRILENTRVHVPPQLDQRNEENTIISSRELPQAMFSSFVRSVTENIALTKATIVSAVTTPQKSTDGTTTTTNNNNTSTNKKEENKIKGTSPTIVTATTTSSTLLPQQQQQNGNNPNNGIIRDQSSR